MSDFKLNLDAEIKAGLDRGDPDRLTVRRLFSFNSPRVLASYKEAGFQIINAVSEHFQVPFRGIYVAGSVQTGYSYFKDRDFVPKESDLDLAIVDSRLFQKYAEISFAHTNGYDDLTRFPVRNGTNQASSFKDYISRGYFRPDLMPQCPEKQEWFRFFNRLSLRHTNVFEDINCGIYLSELFFETKQTPIIRKYRESAA